MQHGPASRMHMRSIVVLVGLVAGCSRSRSDDVATTTTTTAASSGAAGAAQEPPYAIRSGVTIQLDSSDFDKVGRAFVDDLVAGRYDAAYARTSRAYRAAVALDEFHASVSRNPFYQSGASVEPYPQTSRGSQSWDSNASLTWSYKSMSWGRWEVFFHAPSGDARGEIHFVKDGGEWLVSGVSIAGMPGLPSYSEPPPHGTPGAVRKH